MTITPAELRVRYPEFASATDYPDARIQTWIDKGVLELSETAWGDMYNEALYPFTAHYLAMSTYTAGAGGAVGSIGPIASRSIGDVSVSFATIGNGNMSQMGAFFMTTPYGQEYWRMVQLYGAGMLAI